MLERFLYFTDYYVYLLHVGCHSVKTEQKISNILNTSLFKFYSFSIMIHRSRSPARIRKGTYFIIQIKNNVKNINSTEESTQETDTIVRKP